MRVEDVEALLRRWNEALIAEASAGAGRTGECPSLAALFFHVADGAELTGEGREHIGHCANCQRTTALILRYLAGVRTDSDGALAVPGVAAGREAARGERQVVVMPQRARPRWGLRIGGLAVAAGIGMALWIGLGSLGRRAVADPAVAVAQQHIDAVLIESLLLSLDEENAERLAGEIEAARVEVIAKLTEYIETATTSDDLTEVNRAATRYFQAFTHHYRLLRDAGRFDEAIAACAGLVEETRAHSRVGSAATMWHFIVLADLGNLYAAVGDYEAARGAFEESIARRWEYLKTREPWLHVREGANTVAPLYFRLGDLALAQGNLAAAEGSLGEAAALLRSWVDAIGTDNGTPAAASATLYEAYRLLPEEYLSPIEMPTLEDYARWEPLAARHSGLNPESPCIAHIRVYYYLMARLRRVGGDFPKAEEMLRTARALPYYPIRDEYRLDFFEPLEGARIAIGLGDYARALEEIEAAEKRIDEPNAAGRRLGVVPRAEFRMLKGVVLLGLDGESVEGHELIRKAMELPEELARRIAPENRGLSGEQFRAWEVLFDSVTPRERTQGSPVIQAQVAFVGRASRTAFSFRM